MLGRIERCPQRQKSIVERLKAKVEHLFTQVETFWLAMAAASCSAVTSGAFGNTSIYAILVQTSIYAFVITSIHTTLVQMRWMRTAIPPGYPGVEVLKTL